MSAHGLGLELQCGLLLPALPGLLPTLSPGELLVVRVAISSALRQLVLALTELLPLTKAPRSHGARPTDCPGLGHARPPQCSRIAQPLNVTDLNIDIEVIV